MIRLSKKGWNNVLIFSMLLMIMVFNGMHTKLGGSAPDDEPVYLLPENSLVLTLKFANITVERIGQGWRSNPAIGMDGKQLTALMSLWKQQKVQLQFDSNEAKVMTQGKMPRFYIVAMMAGKSDGAVYAFYSQLEDVWIHDQQHQRWLKTSIEVMNALIPDALKTPPKKTVD
jgi:hypothetical protein